MMEIAREHCVLCALCEVGTRGATASARRRSLALRHTVEERGRFES